MKKVKSKKGLLLAATVVAVAGVSFFTAQQYGKQRATGDVIAEINGNPVYSSEAEQQLTTLLGGQNTTSFDALDEKAKQIVVKELAANKLILEQAYKAGVDKNESIKQKILNLQDALVKEQFLISLAQDKVTDEDIKTRYDELSKELEGKMQYKVRHIVLKTEAEAKKVKRSVNKSSFENVAKKKSIDPKTAANGGDLGYLLSGNMIKEFEEILPKLSKNGISQPFKTKYGWHIVKLEETRKAEAAPFENIKSRIKKDLLAEVIQEYVGDLLENAEIEIVAAQDDMSGMEESEGNEG